MMRSGSSDCALRYTLLAVMGDERLVTSRCRLYVQHFSQVALVLGDEDGRRPP